MVLWWFGVGLAINRFPVRLPSRRASVQVVHTRVLFSPISIIWYRSTGATLCGWEGNRRSGIAVVTYGFTAYEIEISSPPTLHYRSMAPFSFMHTRLAVDNVNNIQQ